MRLPIYVNIGDKLGCVKGEAGRCPFGTTDCWSRAERHLLLVWATCANANHQRRTNKYFTEVSLMRASTSASPANTLAMSF